MPRHPLTVDDLWSLPRVGAPVPSPDGAHLAVPVTTYSMAKNRGTTRLWLVPADAERAGSERRGDPARALTAAECSSTQPAWSPDGARIAFVRKPRKRKDDAPNPGQLHVMACDGGEARRCTDLPYDVIDPQWFPDGRRIAFLSSVHMDAPSLDGTAQRAADAREDPVKVHASEERLVRYWDRWLTDDRRLHLFVYDLETEALTDLTPTLQGHFPPMDPAGEYAIAPDGRTIAFVAQRPVKKREPLTWGLYTVTVPATPGARVPRPVAVDVPGFPNVTGPRFAPDGAHLLVGAHRDPLSWAEPTRVVALNVRTGGAACLTAQWDRSATAWAWSANGRTAYVAAADEGRTGLFAFPLAASSKRPPRAPKRLAHGGSYGAVRIAGATAYVARSTLKSPHEVVAIDLGGNGERDVTAFTAPLMKDIDLGRVQERTVRGADGDPVQVLLVHPPASAPGRAKKKPLVHLIHGGPHGAFGDEWHWRWSAQAFAARGAVVALVNFHGSVGWGHDFAKSIEGRWGGRPYEDVMAATDDLVARGVVDESRMAITGGSYGGYLTSWIATQTDRFACAVNHAGVCDLQTQWGADIAQGWPRTSGGTPWSDREAFDRSNPMRHADGISTPMLILHGEKDYRVPYYEAMQLYNVLQQRRVASRLVVYETQNHWILEPKSSRHWYGEVFAWLDRWFAKKPRRRS